MLTSCLNVNVGNNWLTNQRVSTELCTFQGLERTFVEQTIAGIIQSNPSISVQLTNINMKAKHPTNYKENSGKFASWEVFWSPAKYIWIQYTWGTQAHILIIVGLRPTVPHFAASSNLYQAATINSLVEWCLLCDARFSTTSTVPYLSKKKACFFTYPQLLCKLQNACRKVCIWN